MHGTPQPDHRPAPVPPPLRHSWTLATLAASVLVAVALAASGLSGAARAQNPAGEALAGTGVQGLLGGAKQGFTPAADAPAAGSSSGETCALDLGGATLGSPGYNQALDRETDDYADCVLGSTQGVVSDPGGQLEDPGYDQSTGTDAGLLLGDHNPPGEGFSGGNPLAAGPSDEDSGENSGGGALPDEPDPGTEGLLENFLGVDGADESGDAPDSGELPTDPPSDGGDSGGLSGSSGDAIYQEALGYEGTPYVLGGPEACVPYEQMDCTCLTLTVYGEFGYSLPDSPQDQAAYGAPVNSEPAVGDLIIYADPGDGTGGHAAISDGQGGVFHCAYPPINCATSPDYTTAGGTPVAEIRRL